MVDLPVYIGSVPVEHLDTFDAKLSASFQRIISEDIDMSRMSMVINRDERQVSNHGDFPRFVALLKRFSYGANLNLPRETLFRAP